MQLLRLPLRYFGFLVSIFLIFCLSVFPAQRSAADGAKTPDPSEKQVSAAKKRSRVESADSDQQTSAGKAVPRDDSELIPKRDEWFYKQRSSANGHIPPGARLKAYQHMQRMMEAEGKLARQPDGRYVTVPPQAGPAVGGVWTSLGPAPTFGGFFSPVSGRIEAIAVDPSAPTGDTVLIGGAQGGTWRSTDGGNSWTPTGDSNPSLAMGSLAFAPSSPSIVYAGTGEQASVGFDIYYGAGVLKSTDSGKTWTQTCTTPSSTCPFIGPFTNTLNFGFFNDGGARISYIAVNPTNPNLVLVGAQIPQGTGRLGETAGGIYCSSDGGATWTSLLNGQAGSFVGFATSSVAYAALGGSYGSAAGAANPNGIYKSTNANGSSCSAITFSPVTQPTTQAMGRIDLAIAPSDTTGNTVYASIANAGISPLTGASIGSRTNLGVWVTSNGGTSWAQTSAPDICRSQCWYDNVIKVDPTNKDIVYLGGSAAATFAGSALSPEWVMRSMNGTTGGTFSPAIPPVTGPTPALPHVDEHALAFFQATSGALAGKVRLYLGNDGGLWRTDDAEASAVTWNNLNQNLTLTQFYPGLSVNPSNPAIAFGGAQDNGSQFYQGNPNWTDNRQCGDGGETAIDFQIPTSVYVTCQGINLSFSPTGGTDPNSYVPIGNGIDPNGTDFVDFIPPIATDPSTPGRVYFGTDHVYQSSDSGSTFIDISGVLPTRTGNYLTALGVSPNNPAVVYAGANGGGVFVSTNANSATPSFAQVGVNQLPLRNVTALVVDPADTTGSTAYAVFSGFAVAADGDHYGHIFKTTSAGALWTDVSCTNLTHCESPNPSDLPNIPVNDLVVDPDVPGTLYAATDIGAFQGICVGTACTWNTLGTGGLPTMAVLSLKVHEPERTLVATTHGRGAWSLVLTNFTFTGPHVRSLSPISAQAPAASDLTLTVNGSGLTSGTVQWKVGTTTTALTTTPGSDSLLTATVPAALLGSGGTSQVSVSVASANSNSLTFAVFFALPTISAAAPSSAPVNSASATITVTGTNFFSNSQVMLNPDFVGGNGQMNGQVLIPTTFTDSQHLSATVPASFLANFGSTNSVGVHTPPPGGGTTFSPPLGPAPLPTFTVVAPAPLNDNFANAINITSTSFSDTKDNSAATTESTDPLPPANCVPQFPVSPVGNSGGHPNGDYSTIWYKFMPTSNGTVNLDAIGSNYDTVLSIWTGSAGSFTPVACNNGLVNPGILLPSFLFNVPVAGGTTYFIMMSAFGPPDPNPVALGGMSILNFVFTPAPGIALTPQPPASATVTAGGPATYSVAVAPIGGFTGPVNLTCSSSAATTTINCSVTPPSVTLGAGQNVAVNVTTTKRGVLPPLGFRSRPKLLFRTVPLFILVTLTSLLFIFAKRMRRLRLRIAVSLGGLIFLVLSQVIGCGGGGGGGGTPAGTYTLTVTGSSGTTTSTTTLTLIVN